MSFKRRWKSYVKYYERDGGGKKGDGEIKIQLLSSLDTALQLCLLKHLDDINTEDDMLYMVQVFVMMKNVNYSTMPNKSTAEAPIKPVTTSRDQAR